MRCPHCGNDNHPEEFICTFCGTRLRFEPLEKIKIFRRIEEKWTDTKAETKTLKKIYLVLKNPSRAFWMISKNPTKSGFWLIVLFNAMLFGLLSSAILWHTTIGRWSNIQITFTTFYWRWIMDFQVWLGFFIFGFIYYMIMFFAWIYIYTIGANFAIGLNEIMKKRQTEEKTKDTEMKSDIGGKYPSLVKKKKLGMTYILGYALAPTLVVNALAFILVAIFLPIVNIPDTRIYNSSEAFDDLATLYAALFNSPVWAIIDFLNIVMIIGWLPITISIAIRDVAKTETLRVFIASIIVSILLAYVFFFLRPTLGWNLNLTQRYLT
jgi:hypothetical protein